MDVSAVTTFPALAAVRPSPALASVDLQATGLSEQDQVALIAARPAALHSATMVAANLASPDGDSTSSGSVDTYL
jgi:hypothetical protein